MNTVCQFCESDDLEPQFRYTQPPMGETRFDLGADTYIREYWICQGCGHYYSVHQLNLEQLYSEAYVSATYGDKLKKTYDKIMSLDPKTSDNVGRVDAVVRFSQSQGIFLPGQRVPRILDVGSGLCVFLAKLKAFGWDCTALDPDARSAQHAEETVGVRAVCADFFEYQAPKTFDFISFNKVLEHVKEPIQMLARARDLISDSGYVYIELPDAELAARDHQDREEFFIDHWHVFSMASMTLLAQRSGFDVVQTQRLREPSDKYTLRAFLSPQRTQNVKQSLETQQSIQEETVYANE